MNQPAPSRDAVRDAAGRLVAGWVRRYRGVAAAVLVFVAVVAALPSTSPDSSATPAAFESGSSRPVASAASGSVSGESLTRPDESASVPGPSYTPAPFEPTTPEALPATEPAGGGGTAPQPAPAPVPGAPACPAPLPPTDAPASGAPQLFALFPLAGPFGPEALAFLPVLGHFFVLITPLLPVLQPGLDGAQPTIGQLVPLITELEAIAFGPAAPTIEQQTPQWLDYERQLVEVLEPLATTATDNPAVACVAQLEVLAAAKLAPQS